VSGFTPSNATSSRHSARKALPLHQSERLALPGLIEKLPRRRGWTRTGKVAILRSDRGGPDGKRSGRGGAQWRGRAWGTASIR
jgi:hypothetical protein